MELDPSKPDNWTGRDLPAMLRHQFEARLESDLSSPQAPDGSSQARKRDLAEAASRRINNFGDLLFHREPPLELLELSKEFFKARTQVCTRGSPEWKVAHLFYLLSILAAGERAHTISSLSSENLLKNIGWALHQGWVDARTRELVLRARPRLLS